MSVSRIKTLNQGERMQRRWYTVAGTCQETMAASYFVSSKAEAEEMFRKEVPEWKRLIVSCDEPDQDAKAK